MKKFSLVFLLALTALPIFAKDIPLQVTETECGFEISNLDAKGKRICKGFLNYLNAEKTFTTVLKKNSEEFNPEIFANKISSYCSSMYIMDGRNFLMTIPSETSLKEFDKILIVFTKGKYSKCSAYSDGKNLNLELSDYSEMPVGTVEQIIADIKAEEERVEAEKRAEEERLAEEERRATETYWSIAKKDENQMSDEEFIVNCTSVLPFEVKITFNLSQVLDEMHYGYFSINYSYSRRTENSFEKRKETIVSGKRISDGLFDGKYPMIKEKSGREDIKYYWKSAADSSPCVFLKFSVDNYKSKWTQMGIVYGYGSLEYEGALKNLDSIHTFRIEGIRIIYNCDYNELFYNKKEAFNFVNGDKAHAPNLVAAGAKIMDLKGSIFDKVTYSYRDETGEEHTIMLSSYDKIKNQPK